MKNRIHFFIERYNNLNIAVRASLWFAICSILQRGISVITMPIFTRIMPTNEYGEYSIFQTWYSILIIVVTLNIQSEIFSKGLIENNSHKDEFTSNQMGLLIVLTSFFGCIYLLFHDFFNKLFDLPTILVVFMMLEILGNAIISLWSARQRFDFDYRKIVFLTLITSVLNPMIGIIVVYHSNNKAQARIISNALVPAITGIILFFLIKKRGKIFGNIIWWRKSIVLCIPLIPHYLSLVLLNQSDKLMINHFIDKESAAIYSVAHSAGLLMTIINNSINGSFVPWVYKKIKNKDEKTILKVSNSLMEIVIIVNVILIWFAPEAIRILAAPQYADAIWCLVPISASVFFFFVYTLFVDIEVYFGGSKYIAIASFCAACINIILNYFFIPIYGYIAAGYTTMISYFFTMIMHYCFMRIILKKNKYLVRLFSIKSISMYTILLISLCALAMFLYNYMIIRMIIAIILLIVLFICRKRIIMILKTIKSK